MKKTHKILAIVLALSLMVAAFAGCKKDDPVKPIGKIIDNEKTPLVLSTGELDGVFNPFFTTSAYDSGIVGMTQLSMLTSDPEGRVACGDNEPTVVQAYTEDPIDSRSNKSDEKDFENYYTTYDFLIKNNLKFSDGKALTINDVLFNLYLLLDPVYTGSSTIYSTNIQGLAAYRAQSEDVNVQNAMESYFSELGNTRIQNIITYCKDEPLSSEASAQVDKDIEKVKEFFREELESDWNSSESGIESNAEYGITAAWQVFLLNYNFINKHKDTSKKEIEWNGFQDSGNKTKEQFIQMVYDDFFGGTLDNTKEKLVSVVSYYATAARARSYFTAEEKSIYFDAQKTNGGDLAIKSISGITTRKTSNFKGKALGEEHSVLTIRINGVDPKAIWNFSFGVAPMHYYSSNALASKADGISNFGVNFGEIDFMEKEVKGKKLPMGAGPYKVSQSELKSGEITYNTFYDTNIVYFQRNDNFLLGKPVIKNVRYKVIAMNSLYDAVKTGDVAYADPSAKKETIEDIKLHENLGSEMVENLGYGYIGINANFVKDLEVRKAIMHAMDTSLCLQYYQENSASLIYRPMSKVSWAYPTDVNNAYYKYDSTGKTSLDLVLDADYTKDASGIFQKTIKGKVEKLKFTFTIAGENLNDHPMYATFEKAQRILNSIGFDITIVPDRNALSKLASGRLTVWAAAWGSTIDPDMYQVYHKDSTATSVLNWGYKYILDSTNERYREISIIDELSLKIEEARRYLDVPTRKAIYAEALDLVMDLAVELPTYQRNNLYVFDKNIIDITTLTPKDELTAYNGLMSRIWDVSLKENK